ncbi:ABC transporter ATP-binding protein [Actibacterium lipolyticum]|uniref:Polysialic acid transport ATP-binding protein KpsT n=1 Tax=Actibacterium lipolyticum TaxID=1524263 RepID=A0A238KVW1_9RHOB|nr:ABC transporter ATP-binding protein [Actibacterium lipolyticum]SMX46935.1 Polysialic acid transport ATP-binding protein KpsT [Actibacterium lipolyticum]
MIRFENLTKVFRLGGKRKVIAENINLTLPSGQSVGLLGRNGAGKSTLLKMIAGTMDPTSGRIVSSGTISWPVGFAGSFHGELTGAQNARFIARIYGVDTDELSDFVEGFAGLGMHYKLPFRTYSAGMKSRLAFGVSMAIPFDTYLVDEVTSVGDASFRKRSSEVFRARMENAGAIVVSHGMGQIRELCDAAIVLENGKLDYFEDVEEAIAQHNKNMKVSAQQRAAAKPALSE